MAHEIWHMVRFVSVLIKVFKFKLKKNLSKRYTKNCLTQIQKLNTNIQII